jgi:hypothetical protein
MSADTKQTDKQAGKGSSKKPKTNRDDVKFENNV